MSATKVMYVCATSVLLLTFGTFCPGSRASIASESVALAAPVSAGAGQTSVPVTIGDDGKLSGPLQGYAWVAGCPVCQIFTPSPCNRQGCYRNTGGKLCIKASVPALSCRLTPKLSCDWDRNWGVVVGFNPKADESSWGANPANISVRYEGGSGTMVLNAHVKGDPDSVQYCLRNYRSGQPVSANQLRTKCWEEGGTPLSSFAQVDHLNLQLLSDYEPVRADYCVTGIAVTP